MKDSSEPPHPSGVLFDPKIDSGIRKVMVLASALIALSIVMIGFYVYGVTEKTALDKLKKRDLPTLAKSIAAQVNAKIERAVETSLTLAQDPALLEWLAGGEQDARLAGMISQKTSYMHRELGYSATFIVGTATGQYWDYEGKVLSVIDRNDPSDVWYFETLEAGRKVSINFDYNPELGDTFAFVNVLAGDDLTHPLGIVGIGLKLDELSAEFASYNEGRGMNLWLVGSNGDIYLSDNLEHNGRNLAEVLPESARQELSAAGDAESLVMEYKGAQGGKRDLIRQMLPSTGLQLLVEVERRETTGFLQSIRWNSAIAAIIMILAMVVLFFYISRKIANPYKQTMEVNQRLEAEVEHRTKELSDRNREMLDSINYARLLQQSVLPKLDELESALHDPFVIWRPRDVVSGDFFWLRQKGDRTFVAVGDCTGHGVPGAFMTMLAISTLNRIVDTDTGHDPAGMLEELNRLLKGTLHQGERDGVTDDGLAIGLCAIGPSGETVFAGASCTLYRLDSEELQSWKGDRHGIGYRRTPDDCRYRNHVMPAGEARLYLATDGYTDQNGGERDYPYGRKRYEELLLAIRQLSAADQRERMIQSLEAYMNGERQRDDISVLSFRIGGDI